MTDEYEKYHPVYSRGGFANFLKDIFEGDKPDIIRNCLLNGEVNRSLKWRLTRQLNLLFNQYDRYKIGMSGEPFIRSDYDKYRKHYDYMYLLYESIDEKQIVSFERDYTKRFFDILDNERIGGGKMTSHDGNYYVYIVVA